MSAVEVIEEIRKLPRKEQAKVVEFVQSLPIVIEPEAPASGVSEEFKGLADKVFTTHADLFRRLAQ